jgi:hypothetical protein
MPQMLQNWPQMRHPHSSNGACLVARTGEALSLRSGTVAAYELPQNRNRTAN